MRWYEQYPERLEYELRALQDAGFKPTIDPKRRDVGQLVLNIPHRISKTTHQLTVVFPPNYPYFAFQVYAPTLRLARHQDPFSGLICFVARIDEEWDASTDTVASYLRDRLPEVLKANEGNQDVKEAREGAPVTGFMEGSFQFGSLLITSNWDLPEDQVRGRLLVGLEAGTNPYHLLRGAIHEVRNTDGLLLGDAAPAIKAMYSGGLPGRWIRLPGPPKSSMAEAILAEAAALWNDLVEPKYSGGIDILGVVFKDAATADELQDIWIFIVRCQERKATHVGGMQVLPEREHRCYIARADRGGHDDIQARVPRLRHLSEKKCAVFGLGALGSMVAWQLARAGVGHLNLIDYDHVQLGNSPRWILGASAAGFNKAFALSTHIRQNYPFVSANPVGLKVGSAALPSDAPESLRLREGALTQALDGVDIIIDCAVEFTVQNFLSDYAWSKGIPYVWVSGTPGSWGGVVGRAVPGKTTGCWRCFRRNQAEGRYPEPAIEEGPLIQPAGCFSPTFTGSGFDMDLVALQTVRMAVACLNLGADRGYPDFDWDIGVVDLWCDGRPIAPFWHTFPLEKNENCGEHD